jgi:hypothetical protein
MNVDDEALTADQLASVAAEGEGDDAGDGAGDQEDQGQEGRATEGDEEPTEIEQLAAEEGWSPEDKWRGDPEKWVNARTFIRQGRTILRSTLQRQDGELSEMKTTMGEFRDHYRNVEQRAHDRAMAELKTEQRAAVEEGDTAAYDDAAKKIDELGKEVPEPAKKPTGKEGPDEDPNFKPFSADNPWYGDDIEMTAYAESIATVVGRKHEGPAFYDKIAEEVRAKFPDKFQNAARRKPSRVEGSGAGTMRRGNGAGKTFADLPADAKTACTRFVKQGLMTREEYVADYEWE